MYLAVSATMPENWTMAPKKIYLALLDLLPNLKSVDLHVLRTHRVHPIVNGRVFAHLRLPRILGRTAQDDGVVELFKKITWPCCPSRLPT